METIHLPKLNLYKCTLGIKLTEYKNFDIFEAGWKYAKFNQCQCSHRSLDTTTEVHLLLEWLRAIHLRPEQHCLWEGGFLCAG